MGIEFSGFTVVIGDCVYVPILLFIDCIILPFSYLFQLDARILVNKVQARPRLKGLREWK